MTQAADSLLAILMRFCATNALSFDLEFCEVEGTWYASARGIGHGEYWMVKHRPTAVLALEQLLEMLREESRLKDPGQPG